MTRFKICSLLLGREGINKIITYTTKPEGHVLSSHSWSVKTSVIVLCN